MNSSHWRSDYPSKTLCLCSCVSLYLCKKLHYSKEILHWGWVPLGKENKIKSLFTLLQSNRAKHMFISVSLMDEWSRPKSQNGNEGKCSGRLKKNVAYNPTWENKIKLIIFSVMFITFFLRLTKLPLPGLQFPHCETELALTHLHKSVIFRSGSHFSGSSCSEATSEPYKESAKTFPSKLVLAGSQLDLVLLPEVYILGAFTVLHIPSWSFSLFFQPSSAQATHEDPPLSSLHLPPIQPTWWLLAPLLEKNNSCLFCCALCHLSLLRWRVLNQPVILCIEAVWLCLMNRAVLLCVLTCPTMDFFAKSSRTAHSILGKCTQGFYTGL